MREKLRSSKGVTLTELLMALLVVALIGVSLTVGINNAVRIYRDSTQLFEAETLCGTILTYLEDEFRFGRNIRETGGEVHFDSQVFGKDVGVFVDGEGKIGIGYSQLLGDTAYTSGLKVLECEIGYHSGSGQVTIKIAVGPDDAGAYVNHTVTVEPLNG